MIRFKNRVDAGKKLLPYLEKYKDAPDAVVIGLPRGGVPPAAVIAKGLHLPLDIIVTRKIASPIQPELALGALTQEGVPLFDQKLLSMVGMTQAQLEPIVQAEKKEAQRRLELYRGDRSPLDLTDKIAILIDDGIATGSTMLATIISARALGAKKVVVAVPVCPPDSLKKIQKEADEVICLDVPDLFWGVGGFYDSFAQTEDDEVVTILKGLESPS